MVAVEQMLDAASRQSDSVPRQDGSVAAMHSLAICACVTIDDAPTWLIYAAADGGLMWRRVPDKMEPLDQWTRVSQREATRTRQRSCAGGGATLRTLGRRLGRR